MPKALSITLAQQRKITELYVSGVKPTEIASRLKLKPDTVRKFVSRRGLTERKEEIANAQAKSMSDAIAEARQEAVPIVRRAMQSIFAGLAADAERLERNGWGMVCDAAGASSLQRAKSLLGNRMLELAGSGRCDAQRPAVCDVGFFYMDRETKRAGPVDDVQNVTNSAV